MEKILAPIKSRILEYIDFKGIEKGKFFSDLGVSSSNFRSGGLKSEVGGEVIAKILSTHPDINSDWLITGSGPMVSDNKVTEFRLRTDVNRSEQEIPLYNYEASAGMVELFKDTSRTEAIDFIRIPDLPKCDGAIYVTGDSMYPLLKSGDIVMYKQINDFSQGIFFGEMYIISIDLDGDEFVSIKYIQRSDKGDEYIKLVSENRHHQPKDISIERVRALALVKASVRINSMS